MKNRYEEFAIKAERNIAFDLSKETSEELIIREQKFPTVSAGEYAKVLSVYTDNDGNKAVIPQGWTVSGVPYENIISGKDRGLVIYHIPEAKTRGINWQKRDIVETLERTYDQFVWIPVGLLSANATLDEIHFNENFGKMNYRDDIFSKSGCYKQLDGEILFQQVNGYYSSRYDISKDEVNGRPRSVKGAYPWTNINLPTAKEIASTMVENKTATAHLMYGAEYDAIAKWVIESGTVKVDEIVNNSSNLGNYRNSVRHIKYYNDKITRNDLMRYNDEYDCWEYQLKSDPWIKRKIINAGEGKIVKTGEDGCINNIYGLAGNIKELTQEHDEWFGIIRGGSYLVNGRDCPVIERNTILPDHGYDYVGFRVTLCIK